MSEFLKIISTYDILNSFFPGVAFCIILRRFTHFNLLGKSTFENIFICYLAGMILSRLGSLFLSSILRKTCNKYWVSYKDYIEYSKKDESIKILSDENNLYRTLITMFMALVIAKVIDLFFRKLTNDYVLIIAFIVLAALFVLSYRKRLRQIYQRIQAAKNNSDRNKEGQNF